MNVGSAIPGFQISEMVKRLEKIFLKNRFDLVRVYGDTDSTFAGSFSANRSGIKVAHVEAGDIPSYIFTTVFNVRYG